MPLVTRTTTTGSWKVQDTEPSDKTNGTGWIDTSTTPANLKMGNGSSFEVIAIQLGSNAIQLDKAVAV